ncbi:M48 family metalloprotease [Lentzea sp. CA-135723]|uniref:M48 family metalloprotease n=1 Tax=Lentzea sp. CA-135723 TaxID=3239950 RepID=UPI003D948161
MDVPRPDVLAFPAATTARFLVLVVAMLAAGLFAGSATYNVDAVGGAAWSSAIGECASTSAATSNDAAAQEAAFLRCAAPIERERAAFAVGAVLVLVIAALVVLFAGPAVTTRRRELTPLGPGLAATEHRMRELARQMGLRTPPALVSGPLVRGAFCFGRPGHYRIALPIGLAIKPGHPAFDPVLRHELAHLVHHDVAMSRLARAVWYVLTPMLLVPVVLSVVSADFSVLPDYLWRAALLALAVDLARRALLRSREHDADLRAAMAGGAQALADLFAARVPDAPRRSRWRSSHPEVASRLQVVLDPSRATAVTFADGFTVAFFTGLVLPLVGGLVVSAALDSQLLHVARVAVAIGMAPLLAATLAIALWRQACVGRVTGVAPRPGVVALGTFVGVVAGQAASLAGTALEGTDRFGRVVPVLAAGLVVAGATAVVAGLGELWARAGGRFRGARANWVPAVVLGTALFGVALWFCEQVRVVLGAGTWALVGPALLMWAESPVPVVAAVFFASVTWWTLWTVRRGETTPAWLAPPRTWPASGPSVQHAVGTGAVVGLTGVIVLAAFRALTPAGDAAGLLTTYLWLAGALAAAAGLVAAVLFGGPGHGAALLAGPVAAAVLGIGVLVVNTARGGALTPGFATQVLWYVLASGFLVSTTTAAIGALAPPVRSGPPPWIVLVAVSMLLAAGTATGVLAGLHVPPAADTGGVQTQDDQAWVEGEAVQDYKTRRAPDLLQRRFAIDTEVLKIEKEPDRRLRAKRMRAEIIEPLRQVLSDAESYRPPNDVVREVHGHCVTGLRLRVESYEAYAVAWELRDDSRTKAASETLVASKAELDLWAKSVLTL